MRVVLGRGSRGIHLLTGVYLSGILLAITASALTDTTRFRFVLNPIISLAMIGLIAGIAFAVAARVEKFWVPVVMVPFAVLTTLASAVYQVANSSRLVGECAIVTVSRGFPLPWRSTYDLIGPRCLLLLYQILAPIRNTTLFSLDALFYVAAGLAIIQLFRGITGKTLTP